MAYILMGDRPYRKVVDEAADHLRGRGQEVETTTNGTRLLELAQLRQPDVVAASFFIDDGRTHGWKAIEEIIKLYPDASTQYLWIAIMHPQGGPAFSWEGPGFANVLLPPYTAWQLVLAVEQLVYRRVLPA